MCVSRDGGGVTGASGEGWREEGGGLQLVGLRVQYSCTAHMLGETLV